ncbi:MAG: hypothetical protein WCK17_09195 [Verrucomicrobiota bacterium]
MASSNRTNRYLAASLRGHRAVDAEEQRMREQIRRENTEAAAKKAAISAHLNTNPRDGQSPLITHKLKTQP